MDSTAPSFWAARRLGIELALGQGVEHRAHRHAVGQRRQVRQFGTERAVEDDDARRARHRMGGEAQACLRDRGGIGLRRRRQRLADEAAQVGVVPALDAAARQARLGEEREGFLAPRRGRVARAEGAELFAEHALGVVVAADHRGHGREPQAASAT